MFIKDTMLTVDDLQQRWVIFENHFNDLSIIEMILLFSQKKISKKGGGGKIATFARLGKIAHLSPLIQYEPLIITKKLTKIFIYF